MNICIFGASPEALARIKKDLSNDNVFEPKHMCGKHIDVIVVRDDKSIEVEYIDDALKKGISQMIGNIMHRLQTFTKLHIDKLQSIFQNYSPMMNF